MATGGGVVLVSASMSAPTLTPPAARPADRLPHAALVGGFGLGAALLATALPLLTYTVSLAAFGLAHVLSELRYVDERFGPRLGRTVRWQMGGMLALVVGGRGATLGGLVGAETWRPIELGLVAALALTSLPRLRAARPAAALLALGAAAALVAGAVWAPIATLLVLAVAHNLTPVGFLAERLRGAERRRLLLGCAGLVAGAALIATGWPVRWLEHVGLWRPALSLLPGAGTLDQHLGQYVPRAWHAWPVAVPLFSAAVYLQCLHYGAVLHLLPRLGGGGAAAETVVNWPARAVFLGVIAAAGLLLFGGFVVSFTDARAVYSLAAAVHAWIEIPILLVALAPAETSPADAPAAAPVSSRP